MFPSLQFANLQLLTSWLHKSKLGFYPKKMKFSKKYFYKSNLIPESGEKTLQLQYLI